MQGWLRILMDPNPEGNAGGTPPANVKPSDQNVPKSKEEWTKLSQEDPVRFTELTQQRMDTVFRQNKELQEKMAAQEEKIKNLNLELQKFVQPPDQGKTDDQNVPLLQKYGQGRYPKTDDEWNDLFIEHPTFASDLRNTYFAEQSQRQTSFETEQAKHRKTVQLEHSDMYLPELDTDGKPKKDAQGKPVLKIHPHSGEPIFNPDSEKGKLWTQIFEEAWVVNADGTKVNPYLQMKNAPMLVMSEMERRLRAKGAAMIHQGQNNQSAADESALAPQGVTPPKNVSVRWASDEEKSHVQRQIARGVWKNEEEYMKYRDSGQIGYAEPNRRPDFSKR